MRCGELCREERRDLVGREIRIVLTNFITVNENAV
jgi:hypothetical protein